MKRSTGTVKRSTRKKSKSDPVDSYDRSKEYEGHNKRRAGRALEGSGH